VVRRRSGREGGRKGKAMETKREKDVGENTPQKRRSSWACCCLHTHGGTHVNRTSRRKRHAQSPGVPKRFPFFVVNFIADGCP
jgi:hypothetical protein